MGGSQIDWGSELLTSTIWIVGVFLAAVLATAVIGYLLLHRTVWGRQVRRLAGDYFLPSRSPDGWKPLLLALSLVFLSIASVRISVLDSYWANEMLTALQAGDSATFWSTMLLIVPIAGFWVAIQLLNVYLSGVLVIKWRVYTNDLVLSDWMREDAFHRRNHVASRVDNPDQRIQEDVPAYVSTSISLTIGAISSLVSLVSFTIILWQLSGPIPIAGVEIPRAMTFIVYIYVIIVTVIVFRIGRPLIYLTFLSEMLAGYFRYALIRLRDSSESVAFYRGNRVERAELDSRFGAVIGNAWALLYRNLKFSGANFIFSQIAVALPYVIQGPRVLSGSLSIGDFNQTAAAFSQVQGALSFFRSAYDEFAAYRAVLNRLTGLLDDDAEARAMPRVDLEEGSGLQVEELTVRKPDAEVLINDLDLTLTSGDTLLIKGPSGSGKTSALRSMAALWPFADGTVRRPLGSGSLFLSQQPYVPLGPLRVALAYPEPPEVIDDERAREMLRKVQLAHLIDHLDDEHVDWARRLSPGEQQRLGFARVLIGRPQVVFLDEATSAVDEGLEHMLYELLRTELPETIVVSVSHRSTLGAFHAGQLELLGGGRWSISGLSGFSTPAP